MIGELKEENDKIIQGLEEDYNALKEQKVILEEQNTKFTHELDVLKSNNEKKDEIIRGLKEEYNDYIQTIQKQDKFIRQKDKAIAKKDAIIRQKDAIIAADSILNENEKNKINRELQEEKENIILQNDKIIAELNEKHNLNIEQKDEIIRDNNALNKLDGTFPTKIDSSKIKLKELQLKYKINQYTIEKQNDRIKQLKTQMQELQLKVNKNWDKILDKNEKNKDLINEENNMLAAKMKPLKTELKELESNNLRSHDEDIPHKRYKYSKSY